MYQQGQQKKNKMSKTFRRNKSGWDDDNQSSHKQPKKTKFIRRKDKYKSKEIANEERTKDGVHNR